MKKLIGIFLVFFLALGSAQAIKLDELKQKLSGKTSGDSSQPTDPRRMLLGVSEEDEIHIGQEVGANLLGAAPLVKDEALQRYVNTVGRWVASQSERPNLPWHFGVIESNDVNAFAAPGGYVFLTKGLYLKLASEAELAGVLAHEVGHVIKRHHIEVMRKGAAISLGESFLQKKMQDNKNDYIKNLVGNGAEIFARSLDKDAEFEADRIGVVLAARAGYEPYSLPAVLQKIGAINPGDGSVSLLFKTHPHPEERLLKLSDAMGESLAPYENAKGGGKLYKLK
jgi:predicted Zn-dependent protease